MNVTSAKSLDNIEQKMKDMDEKSMRYHVLECAKGFKTSWINLGRALYTVWKDKVYKTWGYSTFDTYTAKEIGIRKNTALKLLRSYYFLEKEEPRYLKEEYAESADASQVPSFESIDVLRQAKNKKGLDEEDYQSLKNDIFEKGKDYREVKKDLTSLIRQREELEPEEARERRKTATVKRLLTTLKNLKKEAEMLKLLPAPVIKEAAHLIKEIEDSLA